MYRVGPEGTPYHTLLVEGYVDGPVDVCELHKSVKTFSVVVLISTEKIVLQSSTCEILMIYFVYYYSSMPLMGNSTL